MIDPPMFHAALIRSLKHVIAALTELIATLEKDKGRATKD